jgi:tRNA 2-selenouridine synthase
MLANELWNYNTTPIWIEDESQAIGKVILPNALWNNMRASTVYYLDVSNEIRLRQILNDYGNFSIKDLQACTVKLTKKLGRLNTQLALEYLEQNNLSAAFEILLNYYDKLYSLATSKRTQSSIIRISCADNSPEYLFKTLLTYIDERHS